MANKELLAIALKISTITLTTETFYRVVEVPDHVLYLNQGNVSLISKGEKDGRSRTCSGWD